MTGTPDKRRALLAGGATIAVLFLAVVALPAYFINLQSRSAQTRAAPSAVLTGQSAASQSPNRTAAETRETDAQLARVIDRTIDGGEFASARWGVHVVSLRDGRVMYARNADRMFTPASNMKLYTTAVALDLLGADYRWRTSVYAASAPDAGGTVAGDLLLYGRGAPDLSSRNTRAGASQLAALAEELYRRGVRRVRGGVVGDESYFRGEMLGDGWLWQDAQWYYGAQPSALSVDDNEITVSVAPGAKADDPAAVTLVPASDYVRVTNDMKTTGRGARPAIGITREVSSNEVRVWGEFPAGGSPYGVRLSVYRPALLAARLFRDALRSRGIEVSNDARTVDARTREDAGLVASRTVELAAVMSKPLGEVVHETDKESLNLQAELLLRTLGRERGDTAPESMPERTRLRNTDAAGLAVVRQWLERAGVRTENLALHDGCGLSRLDLITPEATTRLLVHMAQTPSADIFRSALPLAGRDGTLAYRMRNTPAAGQIAAKTGALTYVNALSGYAQTADGEPLAFSIICNDSTQGTSSTRPIDAIAALLAFYPRIAPVK
ncbi:MAG: D-alanyl-D-alanine carboxypeptidase/D-alanyl-D-alanine-endopeptidase [Acidobacteria bacterium]|nr:D-alanyl-D-alanine carboxypeptidase/D-alanyl-D-alanine-endopeptidase [Acidobacteriota bacterium]